MSYKQIHETFWTDPQAKKYPPLYRYLFGYFISGPHAHYSGLYYLPIAYIQNDTGMTPKDIKAGLEFLEARGHVFYDADREIIFVRSELVYQWPSKYPDGRPKMNEKQIMGLMKYFDTLHKSPLIAKFLETYAYLNIAYTAIDRDMDTPIQTGMDRVSVPVTVPVSTTEGGLGGERPAVTRGEKKLHGEFVLLTDDEYEKLIQQFGKQGTQDRIEALNNGIGSKGYRYKSHYHTILSWERKNTKLGAETVPMAPVSPIEAFKKREGLL